MKWAYAHQLLSEDEVAADPLPTWVADTDFKAPQPVIDALAEAVRHGIFGYPGGATKSHLDAVIGWQARRFAFEVAPEWVLQSSDTCFARGMCKATVRPGPSCPNFSNPAMRSIAAVAMARPRPLPPDDALRPR